MACRSCIDHDQGQSWYLALELPHIAQCPGEVGQNIFSSGARIGQLYGFWGCVAVALSRQEDPR